MERARSLERRLSAIVFTDIVGYSALVHRDEILAERLLKFHQRLVRRLLSTYGGTEINTAGDSFLIEFGSALAAVLAVVAIQQAVARREGGAPDDPLLQLRASIHIGDIEHRNGNVFGDGVNVASRLMALSPPGGLSMSASVQSLVRHRLDLSSRSIGEPAMKNISTRVEVFVVEPEAIAAVDLAAATAGLQGAEDHPESSRSFFGRIIRRRRYQIAALGVIASGLFVWISTSALPFFGNANSTIPADPAFDKSIAVLPFANLSSDPDNAYFAYAVQDELLTQLSKIGTLKVISRNSTQQFSSTPESLTAIGWQLGVAHVLQGSVQKVGTNVRIQVQLIRADHDEHVWGETYDRSLDHLFEVQSEVALAIANQLRARLSGAEQKELSQRPTVNAEAYNWYMRGLARGNHGALSLDLLRNEVVAFDKAVALDPSFAQAWAWVSIVRSRLASDQQSPNASDAKAAKQALDQASRLQPDAFETLVARGSYAYRIQRDYDQARLIFEQASKRAPNNPLPLFFIRGILRRQGHFEESRRYGERALILDPLNVQNLIEQATTTDCMRRIPETLALIDRALEVSPNETGILSMKVDVQQASGDLAGARALIDAVPPSADPDGLLIGAREDQAILEGDYQKAITVIGTNIQNPDVDPLLRSRRRITLGLLQRATGDTQAAQNNFVEAGKALEALRVEQPDVADIAAALAVAYAALGRREPALAEAHRAIRLLPTSVDAMYGPSYEENLAAVQAQLGDSKAAIEILSKLLMQPYSQSPGGTPVTTARLKSDLVWLPLHQDARFESLLAVSADAGR